MWARMCLLQTIPGAFNHYTPPTGMNVNWYWDFEGKEENQVIAFFTSQEISIHDYDILPEGSIKKEIENNRCFILVKLIPKKDWDKVIPGFTFQGQELNIPKDHPLVKKEWIPKQKKKLHKFTKEDGTEGVSEELLEYEAEVDSEFLEKLNEERAKNKMMIIQPEPNKITKDKKDGNKKARFKVKLDWIKVVDEIKEER